MVISRALSMMNMRKKARGVSALAALGLPVRNRHCLTQRLGRAMTPRKPHRDSRPQGRNAPGRKPFQKGSHDRRGQDDEPEALWLYGQHAVLEALGNPQRKKERFIATPEAARRLAEELGPRLEAAGLAVEELHRRDIDKLLPEGAVHQGIALLSEPLPDQGLEDWSPEKDKRHVVLALDRVTDPHNVGAIIRSCVAFGASALLLTRRHSPSETGVLAKTASGALEHLPILRETNLARALETLKEKGFHCAGLAGEATAPIADLPRERSLCLVLGAEGKGLRQKTRETCDSLVRLPTRPPIDQLNVSNAAAISLYEVLGRG